MSKISLTILYVVIGAIITAMYFEVPYLSGATGAFIVIALVYSFVVAKREMALMSAYDRNRFSEGLGEDSEEPIVPEWLKHVPGQEDAKAGEPTETTWPEPRPLPTRWPPKNPA